MINFNLNEFLRAVANVLDTIEINLFGMPTNHSKRIAYISVKIAIEFGLAKQEIFDLASLAMMHDNGATMKILHDKLSGTIKDKINIMESQKDHCIIGEINLRDFPFLTSPQNIIKYHHEKYNGSGFFGLLNDEIPLLAQIIAFADTLDLSFDLRDAVNEKIIVDFVNKYRNEYFSHLLSNIFLKIKEHHKFWEDLADKNIDESLKKVIPIFSNELDYDEIHKMTKTFSKIIDAHSEFTQMHSSGLSLKLSKMAEFYKLDSILTSKLLIATDLHDLGKLIISNEILDKPGELTKEEFEEVKKHPMITRICLQDINGFEDIAKWASNHHEKLDGSGYPEGLKAKDLDFNSRLIACLDIYQALREARPYRNAMDHKESMKILVDMVSNGQLDKKIVNDINSVFNNSFYAISM